MNFTQLRHLCGLGRRVEITLSSGRSVTGTLLTADLQGIELQSDIGALRSIDEHEIGDIRVLEGGCLFDDDLVWEHQLEIQKRANELSDNAFGFRNFFLPLLNRALEVLEGCPREQAPTLRLLLRDPEQLRTQQLDPSVSRQAVEECGQIWEDHDDLGRAVRFLLWFGAGCVDNAMAALTDALSGDGQDRGNQLYLQLAAANQIMGKVDAMTRFWLSRYFEQDPGRALADNELNCHPWWLAYLDLCSDMMYYTGLAHILDRLARDFGDGFCCAYNSLCRIFGRSGRRVLAREAAAALCDSDCSPLARSVQELTVYLKTDSDSHCRLAEEAALRILAESGPFGITHYTDDPRQTRCGYIFDYTSKRHDGRILGDDLITYFMPVTAVSDARRRELRRGFDLNQFQTQRELMPMFSFEAELTFRRGRSYSVIDLY